MTDAGARFLTGFGAELSPRGKRSFAALSRLERAPLPRRRPGGRGDLAPVSRARLVHQGARIPRAAVDRDRKGGAARCLWRRPQQRWSKTSRPARCHDGRQGAAGIAGPEAASCRPGGFFSSRLCPIVTPNADPSGPLPARAPLARNGRRGGSSQGSNKHGRVSIALSRVARWRSPSDGPGPPGARAGLSLPRRHHRGAAGAGPSSDLLAGTLGERLNAAWGQPVIIDNRPGAGGNVGAAYAARAPADGYTLMVGTDAMMTSNIYLYKNMPFDPVKDFAPITNAARTSSLSRSIRSCRSARCRS